MKDPISINSKKNKLISEEKNPFNDFQDFCPQILLKMPLSRRKNTWMPDDAWTKNGNQVATVQTAFPGQAHGEFYILTCQSLAG